MLAFSAPVATALPLDFWGVSPQANPTLEQLQRLRRGGVQSLRIPVDWSAVQPVSAGPYNWGTTDALIGEAAAAEIDVLPVLVNAPEWAVPWGPVPGTHRTARAPMRLPVHGAAQAAWLAFVRQAVGRYGPAGTFWAENPGIPARPIRAWQIWNEENFKYFVTRPNPAEYGQLVKASGFAVKGIDPNASVVLGGLFAWPKEAKFRTKPRQAYYATEFLGQMYKSAPGIKASFDGVALHPYATSYKLLTRQIEEVRTVLRAKHDPGVGIWITELGWSSQPPSPGNSFAKGPAGQAAQLRGAFSTLRRNQHRWRIQRVYWFSIDDAAGTCNFCDGSGLFGSGFVPKPSWYSYVRFAGGTP